MCGRNWKQKANYEDYDILVKLHKYWDNRTW